MLSAMVLSGRLPPASKRCSLPDVISALPVRRLGRTFFGEIENFRISEASVAKYRDAVYRAYLEHRVVVLRDQRMTTAEFAALGAIFGEADPHHIVAMRHPDQPELTIVSNQDEIGRNPQLKTLGSGWHSDYSYKAIPAAATLLLGVEVPSHGGDTLFADATAAFADLPETRKAELRRFRVCHQHRWMPDRTHPGARWNVLTESEQQATPEVLHPLVRRHPETGAESLFIAPCLLAGLKGVEGMDESEGLALIEELGEHIISPKYVYRHVWKPFDVVVWDNRCTNHRATTDQLPGTEVRRMYRITTKGTPPIPA
ncbi:taurine dioxygenase [Bradyrhizobium sp. USDA 4369]